MAKKKQDKDKDNNKPSAKNKEAKAVLFPFSAEEQAHDELALLLFATFLSENFFFCFYLFFLFLASRPKFVGRSY